MVLDNAAPQIFGKSDKREISLSEYDDEIEDPIDEREIFDYIKDIRDPEHPLTLEELNVVRQDQIIISPDGKIVTIEFTPTTSRCSLAPLIGLAIKAKLKIALPVQIKVDVKLSPGSHDLVEEYNRQLNDKERVAAALENSNVLGKINGCIA